MSDTPTAKNEYAEAAADPVLGPIIDAMHNQDALSYHGRGGETMVERAKALAAQIEPTIRKSERERLADLLENHLSTFVGFAKDQPSMVQLIAFTLRLNHDESAETSRPHSVSSGDA